MYGNPFHKKRLSYQNEQFLVPSNKKYFSTSQPGSALDIMMSYIDRDQRYTFINKPYPEFLSVDSIGKRDDEINFNQGALQLRELKRRVITKGIGEKAVIPFQLPNGARHYSISVEPLQDTEGNITGAVCASLDITSQIHLEKEQKKIIDKLKYALAELKTLSGIVSMCSFCKDVKNEKGGWDHVDTFISQSTDAKVSHCICPTCMAEQYPDFAYILNKVK